MTTIIHNLPEDLVVEILSRVPAVPLARLRSTCKLWNALIRDSKFAKQHFAIAPKHSMVILVINFRAHLVTVDLSGIHDNIAPSVKLTCQFSLKNPSEEEVEIGKVFHCDGLLLCMTKDRRMAVWNPYFRETRWIQLRNPYLEGGCYALGKSSCNKYKILSAKSYHEYEIYDISSNSWRNVCVTTDWVLGDRGMYLNGNAYRLNAYKKLLLSFNFSTERFQSVPLPEDAEDNIYYCGALTVTREHQQLCMVATYAETNIWIASKSESLGASC